MCRLLFLLNNSKKKENILRFLSQSELSKNLRDGYGLGWFDNKKKKWNIHKYSAIYTKDPELEETLEKIENSSIIIGHIRYKTIGNISFENTHPFLYKNQIFCHNGFIQDFLVNKEKILKKIDKKYINSIQGETDSEHLFYFLLTCKDIVKKNKTESEFMLDVFTLFFKEIEEMNILILANIIFATDKTCVITRYDTKLEKRLLYSNTNDGLIISTQPIVKKGSHLLKEKSINIIDHSFII